MCKLVEGRLEEAASKRDGKVMKTKWNPQGNGDCFFACIFVAFSMVLLGGSILNSLIDTIQQVLQDGPCIIIIALGRAVPKSSYFYLNYLLQDLLLSTPLPPLPPPGAS